jgi:hypothetical protein
MYYVCVENNQITAILNYQPNTPNGVQVTSITDQQYGQIISDTHYFDTTTNTVCELSTEQVLAKSTYTSNSVHREFLNRTDWKILRHLREKALEIPTSLSEQEYLELEQQRQAAADSITE